MNKRISFFKIILIFSFLILWSRLFWLQIVKGAENKELADGNRIRIVRIPALRGPIYDRRNKILVRNRPEGREYIYRGVFSHAIGYLGELNNLEQQNFESAGSQLNYNYAFLAGEKTPIFIGKMGIEKQYDQELRGKDGALLVEVNTQGKIIREIKKQPPKKGKSLVLNLDLSLQQKAFQLLAGRKGAVIASNPQTGEILALVSSPSFDPNLFSQSKLRVLTSKITGEKNNVNTRSLQKIQKILMDDNKPMFNRAIAGLYPPGSTFKIVTAIAGLEEKKINSQTLIEDTGEIKVGKFVFGNWYFRQYGKKEGMVDIIKAIKRSNDIYFYRVGERLGINKLAEWARYFGLGQVSGLDLEGEAQGLIPTPDWKEKTKNEKWYLGDTYITAIGQGNLELTPLQVNQMSSVIASGGYLCQPYLLKEDKPSCQKLNIQQRNLDLVKQGMREACRPGGTGWPFFKFKVNNSELEVGCKTGTAEYGDAENKTHAWFTVFAPWDKPEINLTVLLEGAGEGSNEAGPVAKELLEDWFD